MCRRLPELRGNMGGFGKIIAAALVASLSLLESVPMSYSADDRVSLPQPRRASAVSIEETLASRRSVRDFADVGLRLDDAAQLLWAAQGITHSAGLRTAPSAGALYPLEIFLVAGHVATVPPGVYRYDPQRHQLALMVSSDRRQELAAAALHQTWIADAPMVVMIAAVFRRTTVKYGERGIRYVHIEAGHAAENICLQAVALGLGTTVVGAFSDVDVKRLLGLSVEEPLLLIPIGKAN